MDGRRGKKKKKLVNRNYKDTLFRMIFSQKKELLELYSGDLNKAMDSAVEVCICDGILAEFLKKHRAEVKAVILEEYDREKHIRAEKQESYEAGRQKGRSEELKDLIRKKLINGKTVTEIADALERDEDAIENLIRQIEEKP